MKRVLSTVLALLLMIPMAVGVFAATGFSDIADDMWAKDQIDYMVAKGIVNGYTDGTFRPDNEITRVEFIKMLDETFGLVATKAISFSDAEKGAWYYPYVQKAAAQGYLIDYGTKMNPDGKLTREEAAALLVRYLDLPEDEKASTSAFSDYNSINSSYRNYVLQAAKAKVIEGYPNGTFGPKNTITRAEALTVLYRAAGSIYSASTTGLDKGASPMLNAVVTKSNVTVSDAVLTGNVIVSEGVSGKVTFDDCIFRGKVVIRGSAKVTFSGNTDVKNLVVKSGSGTANVNFTDEASADAVTVETTAKIDIAKNAGIDVLTVNAADSEVTGSGSMNTVKVNAAKFESDIVPKNTPEIKTDLTAIFNGVTYPVSETGFTDTPKVTKSGSAEFLEGNATASGVLYYYYTSSSAVPTKDNFMTYYNSAKNNITSISGTYDLAKGKCTVPLCTTAPAATYGYLAVMLRNSSTDYTPMLIPRTGMNEGFSSIPAVSTDSTTGYDVLTGTANRTGTIYYYYTNSPSVPTYTTFITNYNAISGTALKGTVSVTKDAAIRANLKTASSVNSYTYVTLVIYNETSGYASPIVITRNAQEAAVAGFVRTPTIVSSNGYDYLQGTASTTADLYYFYTDLAAGTLSSGDLFGVLHGSLDSTLKGQFRITSGMTVNTILKATGIGSYASVAIAVSTDNGRTFSTPVLLSRSGSASTTGMMNAPTISVSDTNPQFDRLTFTPAVTGKIEYYYSAESTAPNSATFEVLFSNLDSARSGSSNITAKNVESTIFLRQCSLVTAYPYVVVMVIDSSNVKYTPVVVARNAAANNGFAVDPTLTKGETYDLLTFTPKVSGILSFYYTKNASVPSPSQFESTYNTTASSLKSSWAVTANSPVSNLPTTMLSSATEYAYLVVAMKDSGGTVYQPIVLPRQRTVTGTGFTVEPVWSSDLNNDILTLKTVSRGTVYYYYSESPALPSRETVNGIYSAKDASIKGSKTANPNSSQVITAKAISEIGSYPYIIVVFKDEAGNLYDPVLVARGVSNQNGFSVNPTVSNMGGGNDYLTFTPSVSGTLYYYYTNAGTVPSSLDFNSQYTASAYKATMTVTAGIPVAAPTSFSAAAVASYSHVVMMIQSTGGTKYQPIPVSRSVTASDTGFLSTPSANLNGDHCQVVCSLAQNGEVKLVFLRDNQAVTTQAAFNALYNAQDAITTTAFGIVGTVPTVARMLKNELVGYSCVAVMLTDSNGANHVPVVLALPTITVG